MGLLRTEGIVIGSLKLGEADKIVTLYTLEQGKIQGVAKGARRFKNRFGSALEPLTHGVFHLFGKEGRSLHRLDRVDPIHSFQSLREDYDGLSCAAFMVDLLKQMTPPEESHGAIFHLMLAAFQWLSRQKGEEASRRSVPVPENRKLPAHQEIMDYYQFRLLCLSGYQPRLEICVRCGQVPRQTRLSISPVFGGVLCGLCMGRTSAEIPVSGAAISFLKQTLKMSPAVLNRYVLSPRVKEEIRNFLQEYTQFILGKSVRFPRSSQPQDLSAASLKDATV